jgi:hypothetical protein
MLYRGSMNDSSARSSVIPLGSSCLPDTPGTRRCGRVLSPRAASLLTSATWQAQISTDRRGYTEPPARNHGGARGDVAPVAANAMGDIYAVEPPFRARVNRVEVHGRPVAPVLCRHTDQKAALRTGVPRIHGSEDRHPSPAGRGSAGDRRRRRACPCSHWSDGDRGSQEDGQGKAQAADAVDRVWWNPDIRPLPGTKRVAEICGGTIAACIPASYHSQELLSHYDRPDGLRGLWELSRSSGPTFSGEGRVRSVHRVPSRLAASRPPAREAWKAQAALARDP